MDELKILKGNAIKMMGHKSNEFCDLINDSTDLESIMVNMNNTTNELREFIIYKIKDLCNSEPDDLESYQHHLQWDDRVFIGRKGKHQYILEIKPKMQMLNTVLLKQYDEGEQRNVHSLGWNIIIRALYNMEYRTVLTVSLDVESKFLPDEYWVHYNKIIEEPGGYIFETPLLQSYDFLFNEEVWLPNIVRSFGSRNTLQNGVIFRTDPYIPTAYAMSYPEMTGDEIMNGFPEDMTVEDASTILFESRLMQIQPIDVLYVLSKVIFGTKSTSLSLSDDLFEFMRSVK